MAYHSSFLALLDRNSSSSLVELQVICLDVFFECGCCQCGGCPEYHGARDKNGRRIECNG